MNGLNILLWIWVVSYFFYLWKTHKKVLEYMKEKYQHIFSVEFLETFLYVLALIFGPLFMIGELIGGVKIFFLKMKARKIVNKIENKELKKEVLDY